MVMQTTPGPRYLPRADPAGRPISPYATDGQGDLVRGGPGTGKTTELDQLENFASDPRLARVAEREARDTPGRRDSLDALTGELRNVLDASPPAGSGRPHDPATAATIPIRRPHPGPGQVQPPQWRGDGRG